MRLGRQEAPEAARHGGVEAVVVGRADQIQHRLRLGEANGVGAEQVARGVPYRCGGNDDRELLAYDHQQKRMRAGQELACEPAVAREDRLDAVEHPDHRELAPSRSDAARVAHPSDIHHDGSPVPRGEGSRARASRSS